MAKKKNAVIIALQTLVADPNVGTAISKAVNEKTSTIDDVMMDIRGILMPKVEAAVKEMRQGVKEPDVRDLWEVFEDWWYKAKFSATDEQIKTLLKVKVAWLKGRGKANPYNRKGRRRLDTLTRTILDKYPLPVSPKTTKKVNASEKDIIKQLIDAMFESFDGSFDYIDEVIQACHLVNFVRDHEYADAALLAMKINKDGNFSDVMYDVSTWINKQTQPKKTTKRK
jgi:hypothetical protein